MTIFFLETITPLLLVNKATCSFTESMHLQAESCLFMLIETRRVRQACQMIKLSFHFT